MVAPSKDSKSESPRRDHRLAFAIGIGAAISSPIAGGVVGGFLLDRWMGTSPWLSVTGLIAGSIGALIGVLRILKRIG